MEKTTFLKLATSVMFLALARTGESQFLLPPPKPPSPLCISQFAIVNHACETLPYSPLPPPTPIPSPPTPSPPEPSPPDNDKHKHKHKHKHRDRHRHRHNGEHRHRHSDEHRHGLASSSHRHGHHHIMTPVEENCCRWLKDVDNDCVCELLVHLPSFLSRPTHNYTVEVGGACIVSFQCAGRLRV